MHYRKLGRSGLKVSPICLGTMMFGGPADEATSTRIVAKARGSFTTSLFHTRARTLTPSIVI